MENEERKILAKQEGEVVETGTRPSRSIEYQLGLEEEKQRIILKLKGYTFDWKTRRWKIPKDHEGNKLREPLLNDKGIQLIDTILSSELSKNTMLSNLSDHEITRLILSIFSELNRELTYYPEKYGVKPRVGTILNIVCDPIYFALKRARNAGERSSITESSSRIERTVEGNEKGKVRDYLGI